MNVVTKIKAPVTDISLNHPLAVTFTRLACVELTLGNLVRHKACQKT